MKRITHEVQVWRIPLDDHSRPCLAMRRRDLDDDELARAETLVFPLLSRSFRRGPRGAPGDPGTGAGLRPEGPPLFVGPHGKPALAAPPSPIGFNLSHADGLAVTAVTDGRGVGVDVEKERPDVAHEEIARRFFRPPTPTRLPPCPPRSVTPCSSRLDAEGGLAGVHPRRVERLRAHIQDIVGGLLDRVIPRGRMEVLGDFANRLSSRRS